MQQNKNTNKTKPIGNLKKSWQKVWTNANEFNAELRLFTDRNLTVAQKIKAKGLLKQWDGLTQSLEKFYDLFEVSGQEQVAVQAVELKLPFEDGQFAAEWQNWKDYLKEQHAITISSRAEQKQLKRLMVLSNNNKDAACKIIDYSMAFFYKGFFSIDDTPTKAKSDNKLSRVEDDFK